MFPCLGPLSERSVGIGPIVNNPERRPPVYFPQIPARPEPSCNPQAAKPILLAFLQQLTLVNHLGVLRAFQNNPVAEQTLAHLRGHGC